MADSLDEKVFQAIRNGKDKLYGYPLWRLEERFARGNSSNLIVWAALSRLCKAGRIKKTGSHRYKGYAVVEEI